VNDGEAARWALVLHGGAGVAEHVALDPDLQTRYRDGLSRALDAGTALLSRGDSAVDSVEAAVRVLEDDPLFNAGRGAVFTSAGAMELDAAIMDGLTLSVGSVAGLSRSRNPISVARAVMERSPHVMFIGEGAEAFARSQGLEAVSPGYFFTEQRWGALQSWLRKHDAAPLPRPDWAPASEGAAFEPGGEHPFGTVGAVALDQAGRLAVATSTGGMTGKAPGRVGDTPIIGGGTYANAHAAASGTGDGEHFIRLTLAREIAALVEAGATPAEAADELIQKRLTALGGSGGVIVLDRQGRIGWSFNSTAMFRAAAGSHMTPITGIFTEDDTPTS
jgi:beta-aspartyl-peptidase (threonine type)